MLKIFGYIVLLISLSSCSAFKAYEPEFVDDTPQKVIVIQGIANFRNVGGIKNTDGRKLKDRLIYRSADLHELKPKYFNNFKELKISKIIDLRTADEIAKRPDNLPKGIEYVRLAAFEDTGDQLNQARSLVLKGKVSRADANTRMLDFYTQYVSENPKVIKEIVHQVLSSGAPVLYHCTAGKDRTGIITALVLKVLKFDDKAIFNDYLYSNNQRKYIIYKRLAKARRFHFIFPKLDIGVLEKLSWVETGYLKAAFDAIDTQYGSMDNYIHNVLGIDETQRQVYIDTFLE